MTLATVVRPVALTAACALSLTSCSLFADDEPPPVVVGANLALTGAHSHTDTAYELALHTRVDQLNEQRQADNLPRIELLVRDSASNHDTAVRNLTTLADDAQVAAIIHGWCAECVQEAAEHLNDARVPTISLSTGVGVTEPVEQRRFVFAIGPHPATVADITAAELDHLGYSTVALVAADTMYGRDAAGELPEALAGFGIEVATIEHVSPDIDTRELDEVAGQVAAATAAAQPATDPFTAPPPPQPVELVVLVAPEPLALQTASALRQAGYDGDLWLDPVAAGALFHTGQDAEALIGALMFAPSALVIDQQIASTPDQTQRARWAADFISTTHGFNVATVFAADAVEAIDRSLRTAGVDPDRTRLRDSIQAQRFAGIGGSVHFAPGSHTSFEHRAYLVTRFNGERWTVHR